MSQLTAERPSVPTPGTPPVSHRTVVVLIRGQQVTVDEPDWCVVDHSAEALHTLEDLAHEGEPSALSVPTFQGTEETHVIYRAWWPFARTREQRRPYLALMATGSSDCVPLDEAARESVARDLERHAARIRQQAL